MEAHDQGPISYTVDQALSAIGFGKYQCLLLLYAGVGSLAESMEMMLLSFIGSAVQPEWALSSVQQNMISVLSFAGSLLGAFAWGVFSESHGRKKVFLGAAIVTSAAGLLSTWAPNYISFLILRCCVGVGLGGGHVYTSWFLEFVPTPNRGRWMVVFSTFSTIGTISKATLAWWIMPRYDWRWLLRISALPHVIALLFYGAVPESPRYHCTQGRLDDALITLEKGAGVNRKTLPVGSLVSNRINENSREGVQTQTTPGTQEILVQSQRIFEEGAEPNQHREGIHESHERNENVTEGHSALNTQQTLREVDQDNLEQRVVVAETQKLRGTYDSDEHNENAMKVHSTVDVQHISGETEDNLEQNVALIETEHLEGTHDSDDEINDEATEHLEGTYDSEQETNDEATPHQPTPNTQNTSAMTQNEGAAITHREAPEATHVFNEMTDDCENQKADNTTLLLSTENEDDSKSQPRHGTTLLISTENRSSQSESETEDNLEQNIALSETEHLEGTHDSDDKIKEETTEHLEGTYDFEQEKNEEATPHPPTPYTQNTSAMTQNEDAAIRHGEAPEATRVLNEMTDDDRENQQEDTTLLLSTENEGAAVSHGEAPEATHVSDEITEDDSESQPRHGTTLLISTENRSSQSESNTYSILLIFSATWFRTTFIVCLLYFANTFSYYGIILLSSQLNTGSPIWQTRNIKDPSLYKNVFITSLAEILGLVLIAVMVDWAGRKKTMVVMFLLGFILLLPLAVHHQNNIMTMVLVFGTRVCMSASFVVTQIYAEEVYPTNLRASGVGLATAIGGIGGMIWPLVAQLIGSHHQTLPMILFEVKIALCGLLVWLLPHETKGRELD